MTRLARLAWLVLAWNVAVILWGAFVRATGSGAGCGAHWPLCNGEVVPRAPALETMVEFTHRATSGIALLLVFALALWIFRDRPKGHPARRAAGASVFFILVEAAVGAALVLLHLVGENDTVARALFMAGHLANTFVLLAGLTLAAHWCGTDDPVRAEGVARFGWTFAFGAIGLVVVGKSGAVAALGDTLYPAQSILGGLAQDVSPTAHFLVQLRIAHPILALAGVLLVAFAAGRVLRATADGRTRNTAWAVSGLALLQLALGLLNAALLAPVWLQIVHLLLADVLWIAFVLLAVRALSLPRIALAIAARPGDSGRSVEVVDRRPHDVGAAREGLLLLDGEDERQRLQDALPAHEAREGHRDVANPGDIGLGRAHGEDRALVAQHRVHDAREGAPDAVVGRALAGDDGVGGSPHGAVDLPSDPVVEGHAVPLRHVGEGEAAHGGDRPREDLGVAVLPHHVRVNMGGVDPEAATEEGTEAGGVERRARAEDA
jgi:heme A synthase